MKTCPVCGRALNLRPSGLLPRHMIKVIAVPHPRFQHRLGEPQSFAAKAACPGSGKEPRDIGPAGPAPALRQYETPAAMMERLLREDES